MKRHLSLFTIMARTGRARRGSPLDSVTKRVFAMAFVSDFVLILPFYAIMFGERGGVSAAGLGTLLATWLIVAVAAEVPTGIIADKMSKKWALVLGRILQTVAFTAWLLMPSFTGYMIGFIVWGIGEAFTSGAFQAYLYESLSDDNKQAFGKIYARTSSITMLAYASSYLLAFVIGPQYNLLLVLSVLTSVISLGISLTLPDQSSEVEVEVELRPKVLASAVQAVRQSAGLREVFIIAIIVQGLAGMMFEYLPVYYQQVGTPTQLVALFLALGSALTAVLFWWMHHVERQLQDHRLAFMLVGMVLFGLSFVGGTATAVVGIFLFTRVLRMMTVMNESSIQHKAPNAARATIGSLYSFAGKLLSAGLLAVIGLFAVEDKIVVSLRWSVVAAVGVFVIAVMYFAVRRKKAVLADSQPLRS